MKETVEEGMRVLAGRRFSVSLSACSLARLESMLSQVDAETDRLKRELAAAEREILEMYQSAEDVKLEYIAGHYQFPLDHYQEQLVDLRGRVEGLQEKRKPIHKAYQEKFLFEKQVGILGSPGLVKLKDRLVFGLIVVVLVCLAMDVGNIGARGSGAELQPVLENGSVVAVEVVDPGRDYEAASASIQAGTEENGRGLEVILEVSPTGQVAGATVLGDGGRNYSDELRLSVGSVLSKEQQQLFWFIDFA
ncbi:MAG: hypothetical protein AAF514_22055, partial [Verrucomicrobiota bacterium]